MNTAAGCHKPSCKTGRAGDGGLLSLQQRDLRAERRDAPIALRRLAGGEVVAETEEEQRER